MIQSAPPQPGAGPVRDGADSPGQVRGSADSRRLSPDVAPKLERFTGSAALANGQINLMSLDSIVAHLGDRWAAKREKIYDYTERLLGQNIGDAGYHLRVSETDFLIALPNERKFAAQLRCLRYLRDVLTHFLGEARRSDLTVRSVSRITREGIEAELIDPVAVALAARNETAEDAPARDAAGPVDRWTPFVASNGQRVRVSCVLEPVYELKRYARIGNRIVRRVLSVDSGEQLSAAELQNLSRSDIEKIDSATIARGLHRLRNETGDQLTLIIPVSFVSLSNRQGRASLAVLFEQARAFVKTGVICEVCDIEGVPQTALVAATSLIKPYCLFLIGRLAAPPDRGHANLREAGLQAVSFEAPQALAGDAEFAGWAKASISAAKLIAKSTILYRLTSPRFAGMAALLGASHASMRLEARAEDED
jgi:hypothetical protein